MEIGEFLEWYEEAYSSGDLCEDNYQQCAFYIEGYIAGSGKIDDGLIRCAAMLRGAYNLIQSAKRKRAE